MVVKRRGLPDTAAKLFLVLAVTLLSACATYGDWVEQMEDRIARQDPESALEVLEHRAGERDRDAVLLLLNRAMLLRMQGNFEGSSEAFEQAKALIDDLLAISITEQAGALTISDTQRAYTGEPFERVMVHVYASLNYLESGEPDKARVEVMQLDVLLGRFENDTGFFGNAFARWLSGMIFEALGERSDAMIAYRKAWEAYHRYPGTFAVGIPVAIGEDLVRLSGELGLADEQQRYRDEFGINDEPPDAATNDSELIFLLHSSLAPLKRESAVTVPTAAGRLISISMPYYQSRVPWVTSADLRTEGGSVHAELAEDIDAVAVAALERQEPAILSRAIARAAIKHEVSKAFDRNNELIGFMVNVAGVVSERADTRSWSTLPNRIYVARVPLPAGDHVVELELRDRSGRVESTKAYHIVLAAGDKRFISLHQVTKEDLYPAVRGRRGE